MQEALSCTSACSFLYFGLVLHFATNIELLSCILFPVILQVNELLTSVIVSIIKSISTEDLRTIA